MARTAIPRTVEARVLVVDAALLLQEIERYLEAVALFRALGCQPMWESDGRSTGTAAS